MERRLLAAGVMVLALTLFAIFAAKAAPLRYTDPRYCGPPKRDARGEIIRSPAAVRAFRVLYACPSTKRHLGACSGWEVDHVLPLACGGCDVVANMQWLPEAIKSAAGKLPKDRWELAVYCP